MRPHTASQKCSLASPVYEDRKADAAVSKSPASRDESKPAVPENVVSAAARDEEKLAGLDWQAFSAAYFPGRRRHDLEALTAYGAYRRSRTLDEQPSRQATRMEEAESGEAGSTGLQDWEDEGGAIR